MAYCYSPHLCFIVRFTRNSWCFLLHRTFIFFFLPIFTGGGDTSQETNFLVILVRWWLRLYGAVWFRLLCFFSYQVIIQVLEEIFIAVKVRFFIGIFFYEINIWIFLLLDLFREKNLIILRLLFYWCFVVTRVNFVIFYFLTILSVKIHIIFKV